MSFAGPNLGINQGWNQGESGWHTGMEQNLFKLDTVSQLAVKGITNTPPVSPGSGDRYIAGTSPTGAWANKGNQIAIYYSSSWIFYVPKDGWMGRDSSAGHIWIYNGSTAVWEEFGARNIEAAASWTPGLIASGAQSSPKSVTVTGAAMGDFVAVSATTGLQNCCMWGEVTSTNTVYVYISNLTGSGVTHGALTIRVNVRKW